MRRWLLFPSIALFAVAIGLIWNFASLNSTADLIGDASTSEETSAHADASNLAVSNNSTTSQAQVVQTSLQAEVASQTADLELKIAQLEARLEALEDDLEAQSNERAERALDSFSSQELEELISVASANVAKHAIQEVAPSVVRVELSANNERANPFSELLEGAGSGFVIERNGQKYVLTNQHVVGGSERVTVIPRTGEKLVAELVGADSMIDLAVLRVISGSLDDVPAVQLGDSSQLETGDWVAAIGHPYGLDNTVTTGIVSTVNRQITRPDRNGSFFGMIQTDAAINPGNSGGPLINARGEVVGINTAIIQNAPGLGFTIAINNVDLILDELISKSRYERAWIGISILDMTPEVAEYLGVEPFRGVFIRGVCLGAPSVETLMAQDVVLYVEGVPVNSIEELIDSIQHLEAGTIVGLEIWRSGEILDVDVELGSRPAPEEGCVLAGQPDQQQQEAPPTPDEPEVAPDAPSDEEAPDTEDQNENQTDDTELLSAFGITVVANTPELANDLGLPTDEGVVITAIDEESPLLTTPTILGEPALKVNQVIVKLNDSEIRSGADWNTAVEGSSQSMMLTIQALSANGSSMVMVPNPNYDGSN